MRQTHRPGESFMLLDLPLLSFLFRLRECGPARFPRQQCQPRPTMGVGPAFAGFSTDEYAERSRQGKTRKSKSG